VKTKKSKAGLGRKRQNRYPLEFKLRAVNLNIEEGYTAKLIAEELGVGYSTLAAWIKRYREEGKAGLEYRRPVPNVSRPAKISSAVKRKAVELKREDKTRGVRRRSKGVSPVE
jgi:transposase-like protein